jgi:hypothetical protein
VLTLRKTLQILIATTVVGAVGCASAQSRDPATMIADAQCRAWARETARAEYARDKRSFAVAPNTVVPGVTKPGLAGATYGLATAGSVLTDLAQQQREGELYTACMAQAQPAGTYTPSTPSTSEEASRWTRPNNSPACDWGEYWSSASGRCQKVRD